jgi:hypothetical protein
MHGVAVVRHHIRQLSRVLLNGSHAFRQLPNSFELFPQELLSHCAIDSCIF